MKKVFNLCTFAYAQDMHFCHFIMQENIASLIVLQVKQGNFKRGQQLKITVLLVIF